MNGIRLALNADTTPLSVSDVLVFKSFRTRAQEAREAGYPAVNVDEEAGLTPEAARRYAVDHGLSIASGFFHGPFYDPGEEEQLYRAAARKAEFARALGQSCLFVSAQVYAPERHAVAGRVRPGHPVSLDEAQFAQMGRLLERIARLWNEYGITLCYHPHVATYVEAPHEVDQLMSITDPELVRFGPDTGHLFYGGGDPIEIIERYFPRVAGIHLKDLRADVLERVRREELDYRRACALGVWTELGTGDVDFPRLFELLRTRGWSGWVIVETDHTRLPAAVESSRISRAYLRERLNV